MINLLFFYTLVLICLNYRGFPVYLHHPDSLRVVAGRPLFYSRSGPAGGVLVLLDYHCFYPVFLMEFVSELSNWGYIGLFIATFLAGSIIPLSSEIVMSALLAAGFDEWGCIWVSNGGELVGRNDLLLRGTPGKNGMD